ncbi:hypothetical protein TIFTF001_003096 [Ficus carica]|uniref:Uncharacterized protein n=1 Tax=Ficus carica TaxID=3494 RepID=A0AA87ZDP4_FICCA|nr:hypothetical protein TIFTF001_003096 [Ficus carica]
MAILVLLRDWNGSPPHEEIGGAPRYRTSRRRSPVRALDSRRLRSSPLFSHQGDLDLAGKRLREL